LANRDFFGAMVARHVLLVRFINILTVYLLTDKFLIDNYLWQFYGITVKQRSEQILSRVSTLTRDVDIAIFCLPVCLSDCLSVIFLYSIEKT